MERLAKIPRAFLPLVPRVAPHLPRAHLAHPIATTTPAMGSKDADARKRAKKLRKKNKALRLAAQENIYETLSDRNSPSAQEFVLIDSGNEADPAATRDDSILVVSDRDDDPGATAASVGPAPGSTGNGRGDADASNPRKRRRSNADNEVVGNNDFIGFLFSSSENESEGAGGADDEYAEGYASDAALTPEQKLARTPFPWIKGQDHLQEKEIADWLMLEIKDFVNYISPSKEEITIRNTIINNLKDNILAFWPGTHAHVFGSSATHLYLPGSDIDMVVLSQTGDYEQRSRLYQLSSFLRTKWLPKNIQVIALAKVPIIKFVDPQHNIKVDISFERSNGLDAARKIRKWLDLTPGLRELVLIVKQFLRSRRLNDVHIGGLGGYATIIMVYHFLKLHPRIATNNLAAMENLGTLLIEFFELYGVNFCYDKLVIALGDNDAPKYVLKNACPQLRATMGQFTIVIQDPADPANNITRSSYNLRGLKKAFVGAYQLLTGRCYEFKNAPYNTRVGALILGDIIKFRGGDRDLKNDRDKVTNDVLIAQDYDSETDGADGNDKYYFSDMTNPEVAPAVPLKKRKLSPLVNGKKKVEDYMSLETGSDEDSGVSRPSMPLDMLEKDSKRDYWRLKGLETV